MRIAVTGASGVVGSVLLPELKKDGHEVVPLTRGNRGGGVHWDPEAGVIDQAGLEGIDAAVHLAGESIAGGRWTAAKKARILQSRSRGTGLFSETLTRLARPPKVLVSASAVGYYGDRGAEVLREDSASGNAFVSEVCRQWEAATAAAASKGIRVVLLRIGLVLSGKGGALEKMLLPFKLGIGGKVGSGSQYWSWIAVEDLCGIIIHSLLTESLNGPVNAVSPNPATNLEFTKALGRALSRPTIFPMPAFAARIALGEMAEDLLLASTRVVPAKLTGTRFQFRFPELEPCLRHAVGK